MCRYLPIALDLLIATEREGHRVYPKHQGDPATRAGRSLGDFLSHGGTPNIQ